jgi:predicted SAM-dependent methyltransferase
VIQYLTTNNCLHLKIKYINYVLHYLQLVEGSQYLIEEHIYIHILYVEVSPLSDDSLEENWYRFVSDNGDVMCTYPPGELSCGTYYPI